MKKSRFLIFIICTLLIFLLTPIIQPQKVLADTLGDYQYTVSGSTATITGYTGSGGNITIQRRLMDMQLPAFAMLHF